MDYETIRVSRCCRPYSPDGAGAVSRSVDDVLQHITPERNAEDYTFRWTLQYHIDHILEDGNSVDSGFYERFGWVYFEARRWKEAEKLQLQVRDGYLRVLWDEHLRTLLAMGNLAVTYRYQGWWQEVEELEVHLLRVSFLATFVTFQFTFFRKLLTSCFWYFMSIATCFLNRLCHLPIRSYLSSSTFWCYFNHPFR